MKAHGSSFPSRVKDSSVAAGILENVCGSGEEFFVGRKKGLAGFEAPVGGFCGGLGIWVGEMDEQQDLHDERNSSGEFVAN